MEITGKIEKYFPYDIQISRTMWERLQLRTVAQELRGRTMIPDIVFYRQLTNRLNRLPEKYGKPVKAGNVNLYALLNRVFRYLLHQNNTVKYPRVLENILDSSEIARSGDLLVTIKGFIEHFPGKRMIEKMETGEAYLSAPTLGHRRKKGIAQELLLLRLAEENTALDDFRDLFDAPSFVADYPFAKVVLTLDESLGNAPPYDPFDLPILELLRLPAKFSPSSLAGQLEYIKNNWAAILPHELISEILLAFDILQEEEREWWGGPGEPQVLEFRKDWRFGKGPYDYPEYERFSLDADWMSNVVMIAKMVYVWMDQLSKLYGRDIYRLDQIPDEELDRLAAWGFNSVWLIGVWERSPASQKIKQLCGNPEAVSSAYSLYDYVIAADLGGQDAFRNLQDRAGRRGIRLASDMVPNHTGIYSKWTLEHPDWFIQLDYPPYPSYSFTGSDLSLSPAISLFIEDGYWDRRDAAVVFKHVDNGSGRTRYIYHGNDGTSTPWNDTAQLNYLIPEVREAVIRTIIHVARQFPIIRFDAAMTLAKKHFQRLWYPQTGHGSGVPSRAEHGMSREEFDRVFPGEFWREVVDRMAVEAPDTLLLAEAFWLMEGYFVRTLGMHRVYNSAFMNMLKMEENAKYRQTIKNILEFNPEILKRFVNFMSNPDERTAIDQFGKEGKYFGAAVLLVTMPGLPMFGHGQIEGFTEKYGMEYRRAYWREEIDRHLVAMHESRIFPLMRKRYLFSGSENFVLYDFFAGDRVDENVFAYSNRAGNERGLILYHNKFASTAGWIRTSCANAVKDDKGQTVLIGTTLGDALGFNHDGRYYYAFRDYESGLEYLRHGRELVEKGMYVELEAYEYHAFLDFREIRDDDFGTWGKLCMHLQGRPVESLDQEVKQIRYAGIITALGEVCAELPGRLDILFDPAVQESDKKETTIFLRNLLGEFYSALAEQTGHYEASQAIVGKVISELQLVGKLLRMRGSRKAEIGALNFIKSAFLMKQGEFNKLFLALHLTVHRIGEMDGEKGFALRSAQWLDEFGLARVLETALHAAEKKLNLTSPWGAGTEVLLEKICLTHQSFFIDDKQDMAYRLKHLFADKNVGEFILLHWSGGVEWFNKERFENLLMWLCLTSAASTTEKNGNDNLLAAEIVRMHATVMKLFYEAENAGYRLDIFPASQG
jgi:glycosidase